MNERFRELAKQALDYAEKNQSADIPQHWFELHNKKFAELIISECIGVAEREDTDVMMKEGYPCSQTAKKIRDHFGVK